MRKTAKLAEVTRGLRTRVQPLVSATVSVTARLPHDIVAYLLELVESGDAKDKTDALVACVRRHQAAQATAAQLAKVEMMQLELAEQMVALADTVQASRDDVLTSVGRSAEQLASVASNVRELFATKLYG